MSVDLTFAERLSHMLTGTVIGVATVFAILIFLWGLLVAMKFVFTKRAPKAEKKVQEIVIPSAPAQDETQLIAVLTAAVAMMLEVQSVTTGFKIKSFRRTK